MAKFDTIIKGGNVYTEGTFKYVNVLIKDGKIADCIYPGAEQPEADNVIDAAGKHVIPGLIDTHVHMREPGFTHKEDITTATMCAAAGGVTLAVDMPNVKPSTNSPERIAEQKELAGKKSIVDFNHWGGPPKDLDDIEKMISQGIIGIKVFMMNDTKRSYPHMPELGILNDGHLMDIMTACKKVECACAVHPHNQGMFEWVEKKYFWDNGLTKPQDYAHALRYNDSVIYDTAFATLLILARATGVKFHLLHLNTYLGTHMIKQAVDDGVDVSAELNAPHFFITMNDIEKRGPYVLGTWTPPKDQKALWDLITQKDLPYTALFGTDHAPHHIDEKEIGWEDMWKAHGGAPYIQDYLSLFLNSVNNGRVSLERIVELSSVLPAKRFGFYGRKGVIQKGADADFAIIDMNAERTISKDQGFTKCGYNPWEGWKVKGIPVCTLVRGKKVYEDGKILAEPGYGKFVPADR